MASFVRETAEGVVLNVQVQPRSSRDEVVGPHGSALKIRITSAPVGGVANRQLIKFLAKKLKIPRHHLSIQSGIRSRAKTVVIRGISKAEVLEGLKVV